MNVVPVGPAGVAPAMAGAAAAQRTQTGGGGRDSDLGVNLLLALALSVLAGTAHAQAQRVDDINTGSSQPSGSSPHGFVRIGDLSFFRACDRPHGCELWQSDGTAAGTRLVADVCAGPCDGEPMNLMASRDGMLFFSADDGQHGREPWIHDPSPNAPPPGMLVDANPGTLSSDPIGFVQTSSGEVSARVYFLARDSAVAAAEFIWFFARRSAGVWTSGSVMPAGTLVGRPVAEGDRLFYAARDAENGSELMMFQPRLSGSQRQVLVVRQGPENPDIKHLLALPDLGGVFFSADNGTHGAEPWFSDGTQAGTRMIVDLVSGTSGSDPREPVAFADRVYFFANDRVGGDSHDLWGSTLTLTQKIRNHASSDALDLRVVGNQMIYTATEPATGREFWRSNGTAAGTVPIIDFVPGAQGLGSARGSAVIGNYYYHHGGTQLYRTDGTAAGTRRVGSTNPALLQVGFDLHAREDGVLYSGLLDANGFELFASFVATPSQAGVVTRIEPAIGDSDPTRFAGLAAGTVMFAYDEDSGNALRRANPAGGTDVLLTGGIDLSSVRATRDAPHHLFFRRFSGEQLWRSDGSPAGTGMLLELAQAPFNISRIECIVPVTANEAYLLVEIASEFALLRTDGTADGTTMLLAPAMLPSTTRLTFSSCPAVLGDSIVFAAFRDGIGRELFRNNGTPGHIALVRDIAPGPASGMLIFYENLFVAHGRMWFAANGSGSDGNGDIEPWVSDGTAQGTHALGDLNTEGSSHPHSFTAFSITQPGVGLRHGVMFAARTANTGHTLAFSDGSPGTAAAIAMPPGLRGEDGSMLSSETFGPAIVRSGNDLFFTVSLHTTGGAHLLTLDGDTLTARLIAPISASAPIAPQGLAGFDGGVMFSGYSPGGGRELWYSDGSDAGTFATTDIDPGADSAGPQHIAVLVDGVYFAAEDGVSGREPWFLPLPRPETLFADGFERENPSLRGAGITDRSGRESH